MNAKQLHLEVTIDEANLILEGLGQLPFVKVYAVIGKLQEQARQQLGAEMTGPDHPATGAPTIGGSGDDA